MKVRRASTILVAVFAAMQLPVLGQRVEPEKVEIEDGVELHFVEKGEGEPIIFIHGLTGDYSVWDRQIEAFSKEGYRAIAYSRRYNYPNENRLRPNHSAIVEATDLAGFMHALELKEAHIVGFSYGAYTALFLALEHPALVKSLTLAEPPIAPWLADLPEAQSDAGKAHLKRLLETGVMPAKRAFEAGNEEAAMQTMFNCIAAKESFDRLPEFVKARCRRNINEMRALVTSKDTYPDVDRDRIRKFSVPTLILSGSESEAVAKYTDVELERLIPKESRKRVVLQAATHIMWVEQPVAARNAVLGFIRER
ncbi:MAG: alpha/beta hydrolase [Verrucomicrobiota bacterium]